MAIILGCQTRSRETEYEPRFPGDRWHEWLHSDVHTEELLVPGDEVTFGPLSPPMTSKFLGKSTKRNPPRLSRTNYFVPGELEWRHTRACEHFRQRGTIDGPSGASA